MTLHCQKCRVELRLDSSLQALNPASFKILSEAAKPAKLQPAELTPRTATAQERRRRYDEVSQQAGPPLYKREVSSSHMAKGDMSFVNVTDSMTGDQVVRSQEYSHPKTDARKMEMATRLFEVLSARSDIDHPICQDCTEILLEGLQERQASAVRERDAYLGFLKQAQQNMPTDEDTKKTRKELEGAQLEEKKALAELEVLEAEKTRMEEELAALEAEAEEVEEAEEKFWRDRNAFAQELADFRQERDSLQAQLSHDSKLLESLQKTNVYNDTFCIGYDGHFGTINGLRLGRLPDHPVDWSEINAALGQTVLLLAVVSEKLGFTIPGYRLVPQGSTSKLILQNPKAVVTGAGKTKGTVHELYNSGHLPFGLHLYGGFDSAMIAFVECVAAVGKHVERTGVKLPYEIQISKDSARVGGMKICLGGVGKEESWTKSCKYLLTCCKFLLALVSRSSA
ncbi:APG6-domain-containing protein [Piedraia hortae CBS 480.64]|uniref:APG6-domain-containing protein n=1 Tax=Piedraia hortae CBS 480.64 TaxID=1314780 RepID=A0A6A7C0E2_9PEZI|nr:APG6-domain-containing protein [Piedraia hortae CBS 480.64]